MQNESEYTGLERFRGQDKKMLRQSHSIRTRVLSFSSGKGGVGKSHTVANLGIALAERGNSVLLLDADMSLSNLDVLLNLKPKRTMHDLLKGEATLDDIILKGPGGISIIPASSGVEELSLLGSGDRMMILEAVEALADRYDYLLVDTPAGIGPDVLFFNAAAQNVVVVVNPEPTSVTDAYALMKVMSQSHGEKRFNIIVNRARSEFEAHETFKKLSQTVVRHLRIGIKLMGWIPEDETVRECVMAQRPIMLEWPSKPSSRAIAGLALKIESDNDVGPLKGGVQFFFRSLIEAGDCYGAQV